MLLSRITTISRMACQGRLLAERATSVAVDSAITKADGGRSLGVSLPAF